MNGQATSGGDESKGRLLSSVTRAITAERPLSTRRQDIVVLAATQWLLAGMFLDIWVHTTRGGIESFFTPWHGVLYSGAAATIAAVLYPRFRYGTTPAGYGWGIV